MADLRRWLDDAAERERRTARPTLAGAWLGREPGRFLRARFGRIGANALLATGVHGVEYLLFTATFSAKYVPFGLALFGLTQAFSGAAWGANEAYKERLRAEISPRARGRLQDAWLQQALIVAALLTVAGLTQLLTRPGRSGALALACALRLALELASRAYSAGVAATRRVHRPRGATTALQLSGLLVTIAVQPFLGAFALPAGIVAGEAFAATLQVYYARQAYAVNRLRRPRVRPFKPQNLVNGRVLGYAVGGLSQKSGSLLVTWTVLSGDVSLFAIVLHIFSPLVNTTASWINAFIFDAARMGGSGLGELFAAFERRLLRTALAASVVAWLVIGGAGSYIFSVGMRPYLLALLPLMLGRTLLAAAQLRWIARGRFTGLILGALPMAVGMLATTAAGWPGDDFGRIGLVAAGCVLLGASMRRAGGAFALVRGNIYRQISAGFRGPGRYFLAWLEPKEAAAEFFAIGPAQLPGCMGTTRLDRDLALIAVAPAAADPRAALASQADGGLTRLDHLGLARSRPELFQKLAAALAARKPEVAAVLRRPIERTPADDALRAAFADVSAEIAPGVASDTLLLRAAVLAYTLGGIERIGRSAHYVAAVYERGAFTLRYLAGGRGDASKIAAAQALAAAALGHSAPKS